MAFRELTEDEAEKLRKLGEDPARFEVDESSNEAVEKAPAQAPTQAAPSGDYNMLGETLKSIVQGGGQGLAGLPKFIGRGAEILHERFPGGPVLQVGESKESPFTFLGRGIETGAKAIAPVDPRFAAEHPMITGVGQGIGQVATALLVPGGVGKLLGVPARAAAGLVAPPMMAGMEGSDALERSLNRGDKPLTALTKAIPYAAAATGIEALGGAGRLARKLGPAGEVVTKTEKLGQRLGAPIGRVAPGLGEVASKIASFESNLTPVKRAVWNRVKDMGAGFTEEATQRAIQDLIVDGKLDWNAIQQEGSVGGIVQAIVGAGAAKIGGQEKAETQLTPTSRAEMISAFERLTGQAKSSDVDIHQTPWKTKEMTDEYKQHILDTEDWNPIIKTDFDEAVKEAKKRGILTSDLVDKLHSATKPLEALDQFTRTPLAAGEARAQAATERTVQPLTDDQINAVRNIKADETLPIKTPLFKGVQALRKAGMSFNDDDLQMLNRAQDDAEADKIVQGIYLRNKLTETPMSAQQAAAAIEQKNWDRFGKEFKDDTKRIETAEKGLAKLEETLKKVTIAPGEKWARTGELQAAQEALNNARTDLLKKYLRQFTSPSLTPMHQPRAPMQGPSIPGQEINPPQTITPTPITGVTMSGPTQPNMPPVIDVEALPMNQPATAAEALSGYAGQSPEVTGGAQAQMPDRLRSLQMQYGIAEGWRKWEDEQRLPFDPNTLEQQAQNAQGIRENQGLLQGREGPIAQGGEAPGGNDVEQTPSGQPESLEPGKEVTPGTPTNPPVVEEATDIETSPLEATDPSSYGDKPITPEQARHSGLPAEMIDRVDPSRYLYAVTAGLSSSLASDSPSGGALSAKMQPLFTEMNRIKNAFLDEFQSKFMDFVKIPAVSDWIDMSYDRNNWDVSALPAKLQSLGAEWVRFMTSFHDFQRVNDVRVADKLPNGATIFRPAQDRPGYFPYPIDQKVYDARRKGGDEWLKFKQDWMDYWRATRHQAPGWQDQALKDLNDLFPSAITPSKIGGSPEFAAVRIAQGQGIPPSFRAENKVAAIERYIDLFAKDMGWARMIQTDPVARVLLGETTDQAGRDTTKTAPKTFAEAPEAFAAALREGRRVGAKWAADPTAHATADIMPLYGNDTAASLLNSYSQKPLMGLEKTPLTDAANAATQVAGQMLMGTPAAFRDMSQATFGVWKYLPIADWGRGLSSLIGSYLSPFEAIHKGRLAGAIQMDQFAHEAAGTMANTWYKTARGLRGLQGRNLADSFAKALVYNMVNDVVTFHANHGVISPLVSEFGPSDMRGKSAAEIASETAAAVVDRVQPTYDVRSMNKIMLPQNRHFLGTIMTLSRWPIAAYNKWYEDAILPAKQGRPSRLIKGLLIETIGAVLTGELLAKLTKREPQNLTAKEWFKLPPDEKLDELAPMLFGYMQAQGVGGYASNLAYAGVKAYKGQLQPGLKIAFPPAIVFDDWSQKVLSFGRAAKEGYVGVEDLADLGKELLGSMQNAKVFEQWAGSKPEYRDRRIFEELTGLSVRTGEPKAADTSPKAYTQDPFALGRRLKEARTTKDFEKVLPAVLLRAAKGSPLKVQKEVMHPFYYVELANRRGTAEAARQYKADLQREVEQMPARDLAKQISKISP